MDQNGVVRESAENSVVLGQEAQPPIESVDRALRVLTALAQAGPSGLALSELVRHTGLNKASAHRILAALKFRSFAVQEPVAGRYVLGGGAATLGLDFYGKDNLADLLHPVLVALSARVGELVHLGVLDGTHVVYLDKVEPERAVRVFSQVGARVPAHATAMGRAMLSRMDMGREQLEPFVQARSARQAAALARLLEQTQRRGYSQEIEENEPGITCVGLPIFRGTSVAAAVSVTAPASRMTAERRFEVAQAMAEVLESLPKPFTSIASRNLTQV